MIATMDKDGTWYTVEVLLDTKYEQWMPRIKVLEILWEETLIKVNEDLPKFLFEAICELRNQNVVYVAMNKNGTWYGYADKPISFKGSWDSIYNNIHLDIDWKDTFIDGEIKWLN